MQRFVLTLAWVSLAPSIAATPVIQPTAECQSAQNFVKEIGLKSVDLQKAKAISPVLTEFITKNPDKFLGSGKKYSIDASVDPSTVKLLSGQKEIEYGVNHLARRLKAYQETCQSNCYIRIGTNVLSGTKLMVIGSGMGGAITALGWAIGSPATINIGGGIAALSLLHPMLSGELKIEFGRPPGDDQTEYRNNLLLELLEELGSGESQVIVDQQPQVGKSTIFILLLHVDKATGDPQIISAKVQLLIRPPLSP